MRQRPGRCLVDVKIDLQAVLSNSYLIPLFYGTSLTSHSYNQEVDKHFVSGYSEQREGEVLISLP
jgi:hypothetical protein